MDTLAQKTTTSISIDSALLKQVEAAAKADNQTLSAYLEGLLYRLTYHSDSDEANPAFESALNCGLADLNGGQIIPNEEVMQRAEDLLQSYDL